MKESIEEPQSPKTGYKERVDEFLRSRRGKMFGVAEVAALGGSCLIFVLVLLSYLYFLVPARSRIASLTNDRKQLQTNLKTLSQVVKVEQSTEQTVSNVAASLNRFENDNLARQDAGRMALYDELNQLILKNGLKNTSGPTYTTLDPTGTKSVSGKAVTTKWQSFYPGVAVLVTVEGSYENLRRFINDIERSKQFVVINEVELQRAQQNNAPASADESGAPVAGALVSLQLNLATYFRRENAAEAAITGQD
ncbi:MAG TPA: GspMb/PilO family protein [Pyrinomonadaceae bacterium]|nr:GspMb/PilO family protein [Pyrinomonadaceae bacterium]